jgi:hypothetical protein
MIYNVFFDSSYAVLKETFTNPPTPTLPKNGPERKYIIFFTKKCFSYFLNILLNLTFNKVSYTFSTHSFSIFRKFSRTFSKICTFCYTFSTFMTLSCTFSILNSLFHLFYTLSRSAVSNRIPLLTTYPFLEIMP